LLQWQTKRSQLSRIIACLQFDISKKDAVAADTAGQAKTFCH
jgi:hypothetical protein